MPFPPIAASAPRMPLDPRPGPAALTFASTATTTVHDDNFDFSLSPTVRHSLDIEKDETLEKEDDEKVSKPASSSEKSQEAIAETLPCATRDPEAFNEKLQTRLEEGARIAQELDYPEGGRGWVVVFGCTLIAAVTLGWGLVWGVFQQYYKENIFPGASQASLSMTASLQATTMTLAVFPLGKLQDKYGYKKFLAPGCFIAMAHLFCAAWSSKLWHYYLTQGVMQGIAFGIIFPAVTTIPAQYFKRKRGLAIGIVMSGGSLGGGIGAIVARVLLSRFGLRRTLLIHCGIHSFCCVIGVLLVVERDAAAKISRAKSALLRWYDKDILEDRTFWGLACSMMFSVFGYLPGVWMLAIYTASVLPHISPANAVLPLTLVNVAAGCGRICVGFAADKIGPTNAFFISITMSGLVQLLIWNFARSYPAILVMSILLGFFGASFVSLTGPVAAHLYGTERLGGISGLLTLFNTPGNLAAAPLAGVILEASGGNWHAVIGFSGSMQIVAGLCMLYVRLRRQPRILAIY